MIRPVPFRQDWAPKYLEARRTANVDKAFTFRDPQGMPGGPGGARVHGGWDIFAPPGTYVRSPTAGRVVRAYETDDRSGPVYGGIVAIRFNGSVRGVVFRHVDPTVHVGQQVDAGQVVARVTDWRDGGDHVHMEIHRSIGTGYGYHFSNALDPDEFDWTEYVPPEKDTRTLDERLEAAGFGAKSADQVPALLRAHKRAGYPEAPPKKRDSALYRRLRREGIGVNWARKIVKAMRDWRGK